MSIDTTINLQVKAMEKLCEASEKTGYSKSRLTVLLMERLMDDCPELSKSFYRIGYQGRDPEKQWARPHIRLREDEYEYALDMRKFFKMSFSAIIALAIEKHLDQILKDRLYPKKASGNDNYRVKNYILTRDTVDEIITWRIYWGIPLDLSITLPTATK